MYTCIPYEYTIYIYIYTYTYIYIYIPTHVNELCERIMEIWAALISPVYTFKKKGSQKKK